MPLDSGGVLVSERISLEFEISAIKKSDEAAEEPEEAEVSEETGEDTEDTEDTEEAQAG
jgi:hypothetical protein